MLKANQEVDEINFDEKMQKFVLELKNTEILIANERALYQYSHDGKFLG